MDRETWLLWLLADSQLPTGGFVASAGLEAALQGGLVDAAAPEAHRDSFVAFIRSSARNQTRFALPFCSAVHELATQHLEKASSGGDGAAQAVLDEFVRVDDYHQAMLASNCVAMRASMAQGGGLLTLFNRGHAHAAFMADRRGQLCASIARQLQRLARTGEIRAHWPTVFGFVCAALGVGLAHTQQLFVFQFVRQLFSAAIRLNLVGPLRAQTLQCDMHHVVDDLIKQHGHLRAALSTDDDVYEESAVYTEPMLELYQGMHDRLYSRIFNS
ncbi:hypothetical protein IWQ56_000475 [Coemansia nantahalensis]|uniref:Uncharacterized protein n=1 Tax=Coemansia nantahalensis TaxID=2789366 RepID=A0ACC1JWH5_9FUNG|nr:hypothetical protein IWQ57_003444 [Coemansia nantahalensis]KAJ2774685.1 hypothetical protein IWQ56_000475 [Coemansia nantahalensis]